MSWTWLLPLSIILPMSGAALTLVPRMMKSGAIR